MPVSQLRRNFHTPSEINRIMKDTPPSKTHTMRPEVDHLEVLRSKVNGFNKIVGVTRRAFLAGTAPLAKLREANAAYANAVNELQAVSPAVPCAVQGARKSLYS